MKIRPLRTPAKEEASTLSSDSKNNSPIHNAVIKKLPVLESQLGPKQYEKCISDLKRKAIFEDDKKVLDVWRRPRCWSSNSVEVAEDILSMECSHFNDVLVREVMDKLQEQRQIILILESPHRDEYCSCLEKLCPLAPAQGSTGRSIENMMMIGAETFRKNRLILCNPVPWQASLGSLHERSLSSPEGKKIRDEVWIAIWNADGVKANFQGRLKDYKPRLIINACTRLKGCRGTCKPDKYERCKKCLKWEVQEAAKNALSEVPIITIGHPSSWRGNTACERAYETISDALKAAPSSNPKTRYEVEDKFERKLQ